MMLQSAHTVLPYLLVAELGAALFGGSVASAEERITLEVIGAVRMTGPEGLRRPDGATRHTEVPQVRETNAERVDTLAMSGRN